jgi:hypothetical protein
VSLSNALTAAVPAAVVLAEAVPEPVASLPPELSRSSISAQDMELNPA